METILVKIFATALALSQVTTTPDAVKTAVRPRRRTSRRSRKLLQAGCTHMRKAFDIEDINLDELITTAHGRSAGADRRDQGLPGINFCRSARRLSAVLQEREGRQARRSISATSSTSTTRRSPTCPTTPSSRAASCRAPASCSTARASASPRCSRPNQRRVWVPLADIPEHVQKAFIAAEDKRFYQHKGIDERGLIRAFIGNLAQLRPAAGRLDHHPAGGQEPAGRRRPDLRAQDPRDDRGVAGRADAVSKAGDSRALSQLDLSRPRRLGHRDGGAQLFRQAGQGADARRGRAAGRPDQGAELLQSRPSSRARAQERLAYVLSRMQEDGAIARRAGASGSPPTADAGRLRAAAPRHRLPFRRSGRARGQGGGRHRGASPPTPTRCARPSIRNCSGRPRRRCRKGLRATSAAPAASSSAAPRRTSPRPSSASRPSNEAADAAAGLAAGARRMRGCRSTTCIGRRPWWSRSRAARRARPGASGLPTAASCRSSVDNAAVAAQARALRRGLRRA